MMEKPGMELDFDEETMDFCFKPAQISESCCVRQQEASDRLTPSQPPFPSSSSTSSAPSPLLDFASDSFSLTSYLLGIPEEVPLDDEMAEEIYGELYGLSPSTTWSSSSESSSSSSSPGIVLDTVPKNPSRAPCVSTGRRTHDCTFCGKQFLNPSDLKQHLRKHTNERPYECPRCYSSFKRKEHLKLHILRHHVSNKIYLCPECGKDFFTYQNWKKHNDGVHGGGDKQKYNYGRLQIDKDKKLKKSQLKPF